MANFYGSARSNYFKVKDLEAFKAEFNDLCEIQEEPDGTVVLFPNNYNDDGMFPSNRTVIDREGEEDEEFFDFFEAVSKHLQEDSIAIFKACGAEKLRYIDGWAVAIDHTGERVEINIIDITELAKNKWPDKSVSVCEY